MTNTKYTDEQRAAFLELAVEVGITRARRSLGYPHSWISGKRWAEAAGIELPLDSIKAQAAATNDWYKTEEALVVVQEGLRAAQEAYENSDGLTPDEQKKLAETVQKLINTWLLLQGKANNISESRKTDVIDVELLNLFEQEESRNALFETKEDKSYQDLEGS